MNFDFYLFKTRLNLAFRFTREAIKDSSSSLSLNVGKRSFTNARA